MSKRGNYDYEELIMELQAMKVPVLILDNEWHGLFLEGKSREILRLEKELSEALKNQGKANSDREDLNRLKKKLLQQIMDNMDAEDFTIEAKKVEKSKELIEEINDKLVLVKDQELRAPDAIRMANAKLLMAGMDELCRKNIENKDEIAQLERIIEEARIELKKKILIKEQKVEESERIQRFFEKLVGRSMVSRYEKYLRGEDDE